MTREALKYGDAETCALALRDGTPTSGGPSVLPSEETGSTSVAERSWLRTDRTCGELCLVDGQRCRDVRLVSERPTIDFYDLLPRVTPPEPRKCYLSLLGHPGTGPRLFTRDLPVVPLRVVG